MVLLYKVLVASGKCPRMDRELCPTTDPLRSVSSIKSREFLYVSLTTKILHYNSLLVLLRGKKKLPILTDPPFIHIRLYSVV